MQDGRIFQNVRAGKSSGYRRRHAFRSSFMALGNDMHKLPLKADLRKAIGKEAGDTIIVHLMERIQ